MIIGRTKAMHKGLHHRLAAAAVAAALLAPAGAQAQYGQPAPLYPYAVHGGQPAAGEAAPNADGFYRLPVSHRDVTTRRGFDRPLRKADRRLIEELRRHSQSRSVTVNSRTIVREPPVVVEHQRIVDDPPREIVRRSIVEDQPAADDPPASPAPQDRKRKSRAGRVIQADAEITILGPDRMSIRLFRKGHRAGARTEQERE